MPQPPMVAIPTYRIAQDSIAGWTSDAYGVPEGYVGALRRSGVWPVLLPGPDPGRPDDVLAPFSGLLLAGGSDLHPSRYGGPPHPELYGIDRDRDDIEFDLFGAALRRGLPVLAICRGFQVVNVALGGTLHQHLPDLDLSIRHGEPVTGRSTFHPVRVEPGSRLAGIVGAEEVQHCLSHHHQGVDRLGRGLRPVAWSDDGLVEAVEPDPDHPGPDGPAGGWLVAVQWHPELTATDDPVQQALFDGFGAVVHERAGTLSAS